MSRFIIVIHGWHVSSNGFDVIELEAPSKDAAEEKAAWLTQQREQAFDKCAYKVIELQQGEHVARPLTWRERVTGRITYSPFQPSPTVIGSDDVSRNYRD